MQGSGNRDGYFLEIYPLIFNVPVCILGNKIKMVIGKFIMFKQLFRDMTQILPLIFSIKVKEYKDVKKTGRLEFR